MMLSEVYDYKVNLYFNERISPLHNNELTYSYPEMGENRRIISIMAPDELVTLVRWYDIVTDFAISKDKTDILDERDYYNVVRLLSLMFNLFDVNKEPNYERKSLFLHYYQYQVSHVKNEDSNDKLFFLKKMLFELGLSDEIYDLLTIVNHDVFYKTSSGNDISLIVLIENIFNNIEAKELWVFDLLNKIKRIQKEVIRFMLGVEDVFDFKYDDVNKSYICSDFFKERYHADKEGLFDVIVACVNKYQSPTETLISNMIIMNYSYYVLKEFPEEILLLKGFCKKKPGIFLDVMKKILDIKFFVWKETFKDVGINYYLHRVKNDFT